MAGHMLFRVLGSVELAADGRRVILSSGRQRAILAALLAHHGEALSSDRLIETVWGASPPASAVASLHSHISRLRQVLAAEAGGDEPDTLITDLQGYRVALGDHGLDAASFEVLVDRARAEQDDPRRRVELLDEALSMWRGAAFGEFATTGAVRAEATRLEQLRVGATADRIDAKLALGAHDEVVGELEATVLLDPLAERPHGQLMLALYRSGRQAAALATYRALHHRLADEVGVDPGPELQDRHQRMLRQDPDLLATAPDPASAAGVSAPTRTTTTDATTAAAPGGPHGRDLIGRDDDIAALASLVETQRLITLTGPGGVGKTRLAVEVADRVGERYPDGVGVCSLAPLRDPADVPAAVTGALGIPDAGSRAAEETLVAALGTRRFLLVLDNCEHLIASTSTLIDLVRQRCPNVRIVATSRERLHLPGERVWEVEPLVVPAADASAAEVAATPAGSLFCIRARAVEPTFTLSDANAATIAQLCRRLDGLPLAIELGAARTRALAPEALAQRIDHRFQLLTGGPHQDAGRHRTLQATVDWSYSLLTDAEARLFDRLSVFAAAFPLDGAERVCASGPVAQDEVAGVLGELVDKSLVGVERQDGRVRYRLLETLRVYGSQRLEDSGEADAVRRAHADHHVRLAEELAPQIRGPDERHALDRLDDALDDLRVAHAWFAAAGDVDGALRLPAALHDYLVFQPRAELFSWAQQALELPGAFEHPAYPAAMATAARGALNRGELGHARRLAEDALASADPTSLTATWALYDLTTTALYEGRLDDVLDLAERRVALADALDQVFHRALANVSRTLAHIYLGDPDAAAHAASQARRDADASGSHTARAWALYCHGEALMDTEPSESFRLLEEAVDAARQVDRHLIEGVALVSLASLCGRGGEPQRALGLIRETVAHWRRIGDYTHQLTTLRNLVELLVRVEADERAALLHGAVTAGSTPSFGAEAERLAAAWAELERRLGAERAAEAAEQGRGMSSTEVVDTTLDHLDALLGNWDTSQVPR